MDASLPIMRDLFVILAVGGAAATICRLLGVSMLIGYLLVGACLGSAALGIVEHGGEQTEALAEIGVQMLLFSIGLEFTFDDLRRMWRTIVVGGTLQMILAAIPVALLAHYVAGMESKTATLVGFAVALSSTVLVFKALSEFGQSATPHGRAGVGILLFQDVALVPLLLVLPLLTGQGELAESGGWLRLAWVSAVVIGGVAALRYVVARWFTAMLARLRSPELVVLAALVVLAGLTLFVTRLGLPPAIGAFGAGLVFSGNRLTGQIDALVLPFRETFAAVFFVSLGLLLDPAALWHEGPQVLLGLLAVLVIKALAAAMALRVAARLSWWTSLGMGMGLAQVGEFAFVLLLEAEQGGVLAPEQYNRVLGVALGSLLLTPSLLRFGLRWAESDDDDEVDCHHDLVPMGTRRALVVGAGPVGRQVTGQLEQRGIDVTLVDISPVNLHAPAQQGFHTIVGDASDAEVLERARVGGCEMIVVCLPHDAGAQAVVAAARSFNPRARILSRCRYLVNRARIRRAGADVVLSEEGQIAEALVQYLQSSADGDETPPPEMPTSALNPQVAAPLPGERGASAN